MNRHYKDKQRHEQALQRYQEDHADEMETIDFHKKCTKKGRKEPKKASDDSSDEEQKSKNTDGKKVEKKYQNPLSLLIQTKMIQTMNKINNQKMYPKSRSLLIQTQTTNKNLPQNSLKKHQKSQILKKHPHRWLSQQKYQILLLLAVSTSSPKA